jgi:predicted MFS family arabinose efflux permease
MGVGAVIGGLMAAGKKTASLHAIVRIAIFFGISVFLVAISPNLQIAALAMVVVGVISTNFLSQANAYLQVKSLPEMRGRVMSLWTVTFLGTTPIGAPIIGWIGETAGPRWGLYVAGLAAMAAAGIAYILIKRDDEQRISPEVEMVQKHVTVDRTMHIR